MKLIEELYYGELCPSKHTFPDCEEYWDLTDAMGNERGYFYNECSEEDLEHFKKYLDLEQRYDEMISYVNFECGFKLGLMLSLELLPERKIETGRE